MSNNRVIVEAVLAGKPQTEVARLYGISQPRVSQLVAAWRHGGWNALGPRTRRPRTSPNAISDDMVTLICTMRSGHMTDGHDAGPRSIAARITRAGHTPPAASTLTKFDPAC